MSLASATATYIVGEKDAVVAVLGDGVDPGVGDEGHRAAPRHVVEGDGLEEELGGVVVLDDDGARHAQLLHLPVEGHAEFGLAVGRQRRQARQPLLQVRLGAHLAAVAVVCTFTELILHYYVSRCRLFTRSSLLFLCAFQWSCSDFVVKLLTCPLRFFTLSPASGALAPVHAA